jgi:hypothetical protein
MSLVIGTKNIKRRIVFDAEGDLGEKIASSFIVTVERPSKPVCKEFSVFFARFADVLAERQNDKPGEGGSVEAFTEKVDVAEQALSDFVKGKISGWDEVYAPDKEVLEFNTENLNALFADREARRAVFDNYQELVSGRKKEAAENLKKSEPAGQDQSHQ